MACILRKCYCKVVFQTVFCSFKSHSFPCQSLLLGTNVPNDNNIVILCDVDTCGSVLTTKTIISIAKGYQQDLLEYKAV